MPDFSDKYKKALEYQEISPDFKERTARLMTELRDSEELIPETAEENVPVAGSVSVSGNEIKTSQRIRLIKIISTAAAAAACFTVGVALNNAGIFDKDSDPSVIATDGIVTEATDMIESAEEDYAFEEADFSVTTSLSGYDVTTASQTMPETAPESIAETEAVTAASSVKETGTESKAYAANIQAETTSASAEEADDAEYEEEMIEAAPVEAAPAVGIASSVYDRDGQNDDLPLETVLILEPFSEEVEMEEAADIEENDESVEEVPETDLTSVSDMSRAASFSPQSAVSEFPAQNSTVVITPTFEDISSEDGMVMTYESKEIRNVTKLLTL
ncbi:MAG: hypothetical protein ACI4RG_03735, partial [Huintestinicola sp.]